MCDFVKGPDHHPSGRLQALNRTMKDADAIPELMRRLQEETDQRMHAESQAAALQLQLKQSHSGMSNTVQQSQQLRFGNDLCGCVAIRS